MIKIVYHLPSALSAELSGWMARESSRGTRLGHRLLEYFGTLYILISSKRGRSSVSYRFEALVCIVRSLTSRPSFPGVVQRLAGRILSAWISASVDGAAIRVAQRCSLDLSWSFLGGLQKLLRKSYTDIAGLCITYAAAPHSRIPWVRGTLFVILQTLLLN
jgi:hypothetical protein